MIPRRRRWSLRSPLMAMKLFTKFPNIQSIKLVSVGKSKDLEFTNISKKNQKMLIRDQRSLLFFTQYTNLLNPGNTQNSRFSSSEISSSNAPEMKQMRDLILVTWDYREACK